jgi:L-fucose isomerase-like protein
MRSIEKTLTITDVANIMGGPTGTHEQRPRITRRQFLRAGTVISLTVATTGCSWHRNTTLAEGQIEQTQALNMRIGASDLVVQPVLTHNVSHRRERRSWRNWGGVQTEEAAKKEAARISQELNELCKSADFGVRTLPLAKVANKQHVGDLKDVEADVLLVYAAGGGTDTLNELAALNKSLIIFVRKHSKPYYLWDEIVHARFLRSHTDNLSQPNSDFDDVAVDDNKEILWRLRALYGLKNTLGRRIVCIGGPGGWSFPRAPELARERFGLDMVTVPIPELNSMIEAARKNPELMTQCNREGKNYLSKGRVTLNTTEEAVTEAFLLKKLFHDLMAKSEAFAITVRGCMGSYAGIMPCLTLTLINDAGYMAYCEGDFVVIPSGILMHYICGKPTYFCNPTYPHKGRMVFAHCTAPRRMDGKILEPVEIVTHYESDHGAATHVAFRKGQILTIIKPDFEAKNWLALTGKIIGTPWLPTCRAQVEVELDADTQDVLQNLRGFHCMLAYGDCTREVAYAAKKVGITVQTLKS